MPTITLANNIGQPTTEVQASTQKVRFSPVTVSAEGGITPAKELPPQGYVPAPAPVEVPVEAKETPQEQVKPKSPKTMQDEERMNAIIRREKAMRAKIRESEQEILRYKAQAAELEAVKQRESSYAQLESERQEKLKADPIGFLTEQGFTQDQITQAMLNQPGPESQLIKQLSDKITKLEKSQQEEIARQQKDADNNYQNALKTIQRNVDQLVNSKPDEYESIKANEAEKSVTTYIEKVWKEEGIMLDTEDAAKEIEDYLTEKTLGLTRLKKIQSKLGTQARPAPVAKPTTTPAPQVSAQAPVQPKSPTLTNRTAQSTRPLTARDRAILAFKRELK